MTKADQNLETLSDDEFDDALDHALNNLAQKTLMFMNETANADETIPDEEHAYIMLQAAQATLFNILVHIAQNAGLDPKELAEKINEDLLQAVEGLSLDCCGGGEHHH